MAYINVWHRLGALGAPVRVHLSRLYNEGEDTAAIQGRCIPPEPGWYLEGSYRVMPYGSKAVFQSYPRVTVTGRVCRHG